MGVLVRRGRGSPWSVVFCAILETSSSTSPAFPADGSLERQIQARSGTRTIAHGHKSWCRETPKKAGRQRHPQCRKVPRSVVDVAPRDAVRFFAPTLLRKGCRSRDPPMHEVLEISACAMGMPRGAGMGGASNLPLLRHRGCRTCQLPARHLHQPCLTLPSALRRRANDLHNPCARQGPGD